MENTNTISKSTLTLINRASLSLTGVKKVKSSEPSCVVVILDNCMVVISGSGLTIQNISVVSGTLDFVGIISQIKYTNTTARKFSFRNIFK